MNEVNDELITPCPMCALKHLHAAYSFAASLRPCTGIRTYSCPAYIREAAKALVLLYEVPVGYKSHLQYAIGRLVRAEELAAEAECTSAMNDLRDIRASLLYDGQKAVTAALRNLRIIVSDNEFYGHIDEAWRELPWLWDCGIPVPLTPGELFHNFPSLVKLIRDEFFDSDTTPSQEGDHENGHEEERPQGGLPGCLQGRQGEEVLQEVTGASATPGPCPYHREPGASCATISGADSDYAFTGTPPINCLGNGSLVWTGVYAKQ